jgi:hypothetical protein
LNIERTGVVRGTEEIKGTTNTLIQKEGLEGMAGGGTSEYIDDIRTTTVKREIQVNTGKRFIEIRN